MVTAKRHCQRYQLYSVYQKGFEKAKQMQTQLNSRVMVARKEHELGQIKSKSGIKIMLNKLPRVKNPVLFFSSNWSKWKSLPESL